MKTNAQKLAIFISLLVLCSIAQARIKLVALPERAATIIRLDNPQATLIEEERVLTLQQGLNKVDFSWKGVNIDVDSIRLKVLDHPGKVKLLNVSYPPEEAALVWEIACDKSYAETVRISYLLSNIDRLVTYKAVANKKETSVDLRSYLVLRNFSGEDFESAKVMLNYGEAFERGIKHQETKRMLFLKQQNVPIHKVWTFDAQKLPWDPEELENRNVGIPVSYEITNNAESGLGDFALWGGKARIFQEDGHKSTIFSGEDVTGMVPVGEKMKLYIGDSRDIVVKQTKDRDRKINIRRNNAGHIILYDKDVIITAKIENFKDSPASLTVLEHIPGEWEIKSCNMDYEKKDASTLEFEVELDARSEEGPAVKTLQMHYHEKNVRPGKEKRIRL